MSMVLVALVRLYRRFLSPLLPPTCRYLPSCSAYAEEALTVHGSVRGLALVVRRLARCHPWGGEGFDPVPGPHARHAAPVCPVRKEA